MKLYQALITYS